MPDGADDGGIAVSRRSNGGGAVVSIGGELDMVSAPKLRGALAEALEDCEDGGGLVLDLTGVTFCDSTGLNTLLRARRRALSDHRFVVIRAASPQVTHLLEITGAAHLFADTT
ncbi:STAS domain-containing protein [Streptomyces sp. LMG1-1-1.1]